MRKFRPILLICGIPLLLLVIYYLPLVQYRSPAVSGIAVDSKTGKPIAGLTVTVSWSAMRSKFNNIEDADLLDIHTETAVTDANGAFKFPAWGPVSCSSSWGYCSYTPTVSFSKSGVNLGFWDDNPDSRADEINPFPFETVEFGKPCWDGQQLKLPQWPLAKPLW